MMEPVTTSMMHISESKTICSSLSCNTSENDEISKKLEDELLYGVDDDADEEDALSDDSLRLRLSDDEVDGDDNTAISCSINNQLKSVKTEPPADSCPSEAAENFDDIASQDQHDEPLFNSNNLTEVDSKLSSVVAESDSSNQELATIVISSCASEVQDQVQTVETSTTENVLQDVSESDGNPAEPPTSIVDSESLNLQKDEEEKLVDNCPPVDNDTDHLNSDANELDIAESTSVSNDQVKLHLDAESQNDLAGPVSTTNLQDDNERIANNLAEEQKEGNVGAEETSYSLSIDTVPVKQEIPSPKSDSTDKANNKRRLSESDSDEMRIQSKVLCQEFVEGSSKPVSMQKNATVKICQGPDGVSELEKIMKFEGKAVSDEPSLKSDVVDGDSCNTDMENTSFVEKPELENKSNKNDERIEKEDEVDKSHGESVKSKRRRKRRKTISPNTINQFPMHFPIQEKENVRQKRETAQKAQEMIRKLNHESDSDSDEKLSKVSYKSRNSQSLSPSTLKRSLYDHEEGFDGTSKKSKADIGATYAEVIESVASDNKHTLKYVRNLFLRDTKQNIPKLTQEQLEELLIQKVVETITMRDEIGKLREQARISERNQEATRVKCQQLAKQIKDFEMVLTRFGADRRTNEKTATPIKINRSVGLQVSFVTENGIQNLRQISTMKSNPLPNGVNTLVKSNDEALNKKGIKVRSPRRPEVPVSSPVTSITSVANTPIMINSSTSSASLSSRGLVITKAAVEPRQTILTTITPPVVNQQLPNQALTLNVHGVSIHPNNANHQTKVLNIHSNDKNSSNSNNTSNNNNMNTSVNNSGVNSNINANITASVNASLIDLTEEEEKNRPPTDPPPLSTISVQAKDHPTSSNTSPRYQRIVQPAPANVTLSQTAIKVIQPADKPTPTALVNNVTSPRLTLVMKGGAGQPQLFIANSNQIRPVVNTAPRPPFSGITYSGVMSGQTISNGQVRVVPASNVTPAQKPKHPAALPAPQKYPMIPSLKLPPPAPSLKISKAPNGIVLSWNMALSDKYAEIASYQLYAYQEVTGMLPRSTLWRKVGDVRALALPMACTLTQFTEGNTYYFAVRAVDTHSRVGSYSRPGSIFL